MWKKLQRWKEKLLSQVGREVLIKAVVQTIPTYIMSCFKLPKVLIKDLEILTRKFWWGYGGDSRKVHWVNWKKLCQAKNAGGMGFKELKILMTPYWRNRFGEWLTTWTLFAIECSKLDFSQTVQFWMLRSQQQAHMRGRASLMLEMWFKKVWFGALGTVKMFGSRRIGGCQWTQVAPSPPSAFNGSWDQSSGSYKSWLRCMETRPHSPAVFSLWSYYNPGYSSKSALPTW